MSNIRYLIKVTATAKPNNPSYAGAVITYYYGRNQQLLGSHHEKFTAHIELDLIPYLIDRYGYRTRSTKKAEQFWNSLNSDPNFDFWTYQTETVAYNLETRSLVTQYT